MRRRDDAGGVVLEFVLVLPAVLAVIGLVIGAGYLGLCRVLVDHSARAGLRAAVVPDSADLRQYPDQIDITEVVDDASPLFTPTAVTVTGTSVRNAPVTVAVSYTVTNPVAVLFAPLAVFGIDDPVPDTLTMTASAQGRRE